MRAAISCPADELPEFSSGLVVCSGAGSPSFVPDSTLAQLDSADLLLLMSALMTAVALAASFNVVARLLGYK